MLKEYDYVIVGAGLWGCVFAYEATNRGYKCLLIDKRKKQYMYLIRHNIYYYNYILFIT